MDSPERKCLGKFANSCQKVKWNTPPVVPWCIFVDQNLWFHLTEVFYNGFLVEMRSVVNTSSCFIQHLKIHYTQVFKLFLGFGLNGLGQGCPNSVLGGRCPAEFSSKFQPSLNIPEAANQGFICILETSMQVCWGMLEINSAGHGPPGLSLDSPGLGINIQLCSCVKVSWWTKCVRIRFCC